MNRIRRLIAQLLTSINSSYWFIPSIFCIIGISLAVLLIHIDRIGFITIPQNIKWLLASQPNGARAILSTIAGSMITVAGVTFSMTLLSVSHASAQIGPRILPSFMEDKGNQVTLGTFITTFIYCLLVLNSIYGGTESGKVETFVPNLAILGAMILALASIFILIYFINHVPKTIGMTNAIESVGNNLLAGIDKMYPEKIGKDSDSSKIKDSKIEQPKDFKSNNFSLCANGKGYIRSLNGNGILELANSNKLIIEILKNPGEFVSKQTPIAAIYPQSQVTDELEANIRDMFVWSAERSYNQDIQFAINLLIEVAARALSPGVNDPYTAIECINQLRAGLIDLSDRSIPNDFRFDDSKNLRVIAKTPSFEDYIHNTFDELRQYVKRDPLTAKHLLRTLAFLKGYFKSEASKKVIDIQANALFDACEKSLNDSRDLELLKKLKKKVQST